MVQPQCVHRWRRALQRGVYSHIQEDYSSLLSPDTHRHTNQNNKMAHLYIGRDKAQTAPGHMYRGYAFTRIITQNALHKIIEKS